MRSSVTSTVVLVGFTAGLASIYGGCTVTAEDPSPFTGMSGSGGASVFPTAGSSSGGSTSMAGTPAAAGATTTGGTPTAGGATTGGASTAGTGPTAGAAGTGTGGSAAGGGEITKVWKSDGCGKAFAGQSGAKVTIVTMGTKAADCADKLAGVSKCGPFTVNRDYYPYMPAAYDMNKAYPLVIEGPGCGGNGTNIYPLPLIANESIRIGITPPPNSVGHGTNENQGCFDDKEGDDSVDWAFYEAFYDKLNAEVCFDRNRVFSAGNSSGSWFSNELGCKYAGDAKRPVRGVMPNTGGLPNEAKFSPTCTTKPMSGMWVHEINDGTNPFTGNKFAIDRAIKVNGCTGAMSYDAKVAANEFKNFPIGGNNPDNTCQLLSGCPEIYPLVVCPLPGDQHGGHDSVVNPGFATFVKMFSAGNFLTQ